MVIGRLCVVVVVGGREVAAAAEVGVGGELELRQGSATCGDDVVDDEEADGADDGSNGGLNRRRRPQVLCGLRREIGRLR
jgi:hypothetical protein